MSGIPAFNFPAFRKATAELRAQGFEVVSPAEEDHKAGIGAAAEESKTGNPGEIPGVTWGSVLARDVQLIADEGIEGIVFLPDWQRSRGAKLEAFVGLLQKPFQFYLYRDGNTPEKISRHFVCSVMFSQMKNEEFK